MQNGKNNLSTSSYSLANALLFAIALGALSLFAILGKGQEIVELIGTLLPGYAATGSGLFLGLVWGFLIGGIGGIILSWFYNKMV